MGWVWIFSGTKHWVVVVKMIMEIMMIIDSGDGGSGDENGSLCSRCKWGSRRGSWKGGEKMDPDLPFLPTC